MYADKVDRSQFPRFALAKMKMIATALEKRFPGKVAHDEAAVQGGLNVLLAD
ncbi:hypothetical protein KMZ68_20965 [Bradyrhizobium sediminis]|uniref:Uncharacterized protein n=1 Tax=Bradyrhizobium sediminis TaxID=2840469 RepID=A0A975RS01_9BRAD|nr:hypothetical protein [Bradyrhizobium sediminis]QWG17413.1 hypothetical protein KMZ68_20965 [Bradyrhizobium sediminis]